MKTRLKINSTEIILKRFPFRQNDKLQAWDASDEYLLKHVLDNNLIQENQNVLIFNDTFGAITLGLQNFNPDTTSDSYLAYAGIKANYAFNKLTFNENQFLKSTDELSKKYDVIIIKVPKNISYLEDFLSKIAPLMTESTVLISAAMVKDLHSSTLEVYENIIGETKTSLALKKSRLVFTTKTNNENLASKFPVKLSSEDKKLDYINYSNVFSNDKIDSGTKYFVENLPKSQDRKTIIDLGCGNGLVGIYAASENPNAKIVFLDESLMAIQSAKENIAAIHPKKVVEFKWSNCLESYNQYADLILCNPPFDLANGMSDHIAWKMFSGALKVLKEGGVLRVIGTRHLKYDVKLKKAFGNCKVIASNQKYIIHEVIKE